MRAARFPPWELIRFLVVGLANTLVGLSVIFGLKYFLAVGDIAANMAGYAVGLTLSFLLNRAWTFRHSGPVGRAMLRFGAAFAISYSLNLAVVVLLIDHAGVNSYLAQAIALVHYTGCFFILSKLFVFR